MKKLDAFPTPSPKPRQPLPLPPEPTTAVPVANLPPAPPTPAQVAVSRSANGSVLAGRVPAGLAAPKVEKLTDEQQSIITAALAMGAGDVLVIEAGAGTGKTFTLAKLARALPGRGQYTAFNSKLVEDSASKFPSSCPCNTTHSLAFRAVGRQYAHRLPKKGGPKRLRSGEIAAVLGIHDDTCSTPDGQPRRISAATLASWVMGAVKRFCQSADRQVGPHHFSRLPSVDAVGSTENEDRLRDAMVPAAQAAWSDLSSTTGQLPFQHDHYVKIWQLGSPVISADYILLDEHQDTAPVMLDVLKQQVARGVKLILVGDGNQRIYDWRGAINAGDAFPNAPRRYLSQSFRFGEVIAMVANAVLRHLGEPTKLVMKGLATKASRLGTLARPACILTRTNAAGVRLMFDAIADGRRAHLVGGGGDVVDFCRAARDLQAGKLTEHPDLSCFESWTEVQVYSKTDEGDDIKLLVKLVDAFGAQKIIDALEHMCEERDADVVICTAHRSKGKEWDTVKLASDFPTLDKMRDSDVRLLYVAGTRAKLVLDVSECPPFCGGGGRDKSDYGEGKSSPVINIDAARAFRVEVVAEQTDLFGEPIPPDAPATQEPAPTPRPTGTPEDNTFTKGRNGDWLVRGPRGQSGRVEVRLKSGKRAMKTIEKLVWEDAAQGVALYAITNDRS